jgi:hypothetical protein
MKEVVLQYEQVILYHLWGVLSVYGFPTPITGLGRTVSEVLPGAAAGMWPVTRNSSVVTQALFNGHALTRKSRYYVHLNLQSDGSEISRVRNTTSHAEI